MLNPTLMAKFILDKHRIEKSVSLLLKKCQGKNIKTILSKTHIFKCIYFGHLMQSAYSLEKTLILGKTEGKKRRGRQRIR